MKWSRVALLTVLVLAAGGCSRAYYSAMEKVGIHKRDIMVDRVEQARDAQKEGEEQFRSALEAFQSVTGFDGGDLEDVYKRLNREYEDSKAAADEISEKIDRIEDVSKAMFGEWRDELKAYSSASLKRQSEQQLKETERRYKQLIDAMRNAESRIDPVLQVMLDQVLFLKHNLNARAIQSLKTEVPQINADVDRLLRAMREAIAEADAFVADLREG